MTRAAAALAFGTADVIDLIDVVDREPGEGEVLVAVRAAGLNPYELKRVRGDFGTDPAQLPLRLGSEAAGVVTAVGGGAAPTLADGSPVAVGNEVFGSRFSGAAAARVVTKAGGLLRKPAALSFEEAAGLLSVGTTAAHALVAIGLADATAARGAVVLIHGVAGSVGRLAAQLALHRGARVVGTAAPARHDELRELGVEPVVYGDGLAARVRALAPDGVDAAIDTVGTDEALHVSLDLSDDPARVVTIVNFAAAVAAGAQAIGGGPGADPGSAIRADARFELAALAAEGAITVPLARVLPLSEARAGYQLIEGGHAGGKVVLTP